MKLNWQYNPISCFVPIPLLGYVAAAFNSTSSRSTQVGGGGSTAGRALNYQERAILERDEAYKERMRRKKSGELDELEKAPTPRFDELFREESYLDKVRSGKAGMRWRWAEGSAPADHAAKKPKEAEAAAARAAASARQRRRGAPPVRAPFGVVIKPDLGGNDEMDI